MFKLKLQKSDPRIRKILLALLFISAFAIGSFGSLFYLNFINNFMKSKPSLNQQDQIPSLPKTSYNFLLLGYGGAGHDGGTLSDAIVIVNVNPDKKKVTLISIPRDLWVEIPVRSDIKEKYKINHAYAIGLDDTRYPLKEPQYKGEGGGATMAKKVVGEVFGMVPDYYISVDFGGFKNIIDILGGVEVDVPVAFDDSFYPIKGKENDTCGKSAGEIARLHSLYSDTQLHHQFECRYENIHYDKGMKHMDGETALKFVRSRASLQHGGDFARSQRQQALLLAVKEKLFSMNAVKKIDELFNEFAKMIETDLDIKTIKGLVKVLGEMEEYKVSFIGLNEDNALVSTKSLDGQFILIPKEGEVIWGGVQKYIFELINAD